MTGKLTPPFVAAHESILVSDLDDGCVRLYLWLEMRIGGQEDWDRSVVQAAHELAWQSRRVQAHAEHLATARVDRVVVPRSEGLTEDEDPLSAGPWRHRRHREVGTADAVGAATSTDHQRARAYAVIVDA